MEREPILTIIVTVREAYGMPGVTMVPFTARAEGVFCGETLGQCVDTQITDADGFHFSARYMMEGTDQTGAPCRLFVENNGSDLADCHPRILTDSTALRYLNDAALTGAAEITETGVIVRFYLT